MNAVITVVKRELSSYIVTPVAYVFIVVFLLVTSLFTFAEGLGNFFAAGQADLRAFFRFHPWLYLFLIPAVSMRLWSEERRTGTIELLMTLPIPAWAAVLGKFIAAWSFTGLALALTAPLWYTVDYLGDPDHGVILAAYIGSFLMAGAFLAIGSAVSALTKSQVVAFVLTAVVGLVFLLAGLPAVINVLEGWAPDWLVRAVSSLSFLARFDAISRGVLAPRDAAYFVTLIAVFLGATSLLVELRKAS